MEKPKIAIWRYVLAVIALWAMTLAGGTMIMYVLALFSPEGAIAPILITIFGGAVGVGFGNDLARNCFGQNFAPLFMLVNNVILATALVSFALFAYLFDALTLKFGLQCAFAAAAAGCYIHALSKEVREGKG